ncbi:hypothetical protein PFISCL1PPCAC_24984, partial [Pristionchus fissidentatus]
ESRMIYLQKRYLIDKRLKSLLEIEENVVGDILLDEITSIRTIVDHFTIDGYLVLGDDSLLIQLAESGLIHFCSNEMI